MAKNNEPAPVKPEPTGVGAAVAAAQGDAPANPNLPATAPHFEGDGAAVVLNGRAFKAKQITRSVFPQKVGQTIFVQITGKPYVGKPLANAGTGPKMEPATLVEATNLQTGELGLIIVNKVLEGVLDEQFPNETYVGKNFGITMKDGPEGKRYKTFIVFELEAA